MRITRFILLSFFAVALSAQATAEEAILSFHSHIMVGADGVLDVTETIRVRAEGKAIRRGIFREFPTDYTGPGGTRTRTGIDVIEVLMNGGLVNWTTEPMGNGVGIRIGSRDISLRPGEYTYIIHYTSPRQLRFFDDADELYWNVTGQDWAFPIDHASAVIVPPPGASLRRVTAYTGRQGEEGGDITASQVNGRAEFATTRRLDRGEGFSVVADWPAGFVARPTASEELGLTLRQNTSIVVGLIGLLVLLAYFIVAWVKAGQDPDGGPIIARYKPPEGFSPAASNFVHNMGFNDAAFAAAIVSMAVKGHLTISGDLDDSPSLILTGQKAPLSPGEKAISHKLFLNEREGANFRIDQEYHDTLKRARGALGRSLASEYEAAHFKHNSGYVWLGIVIGLATLGGMALLSPDPEIVGFLMLWLSIWCSGLYGFAGRVQGRWALALASGSATKMVVSLFATIALAPFLIGAGFGFYMLANAMPWPAVVIAGLVILLVLVFHHLLKAPTRLGRRIMDEIEGFRLYLSVAEKDRMNFRNPPERTPELFEKFLPYAIALGVEQQWGEGFDAILQAAAESPDRGYQPRWYHGYHHGHFSGASFASSLGSGLSNTISSAATAPSSGGSGFSGGGGAGGGGGGGGGGGW